MKDYKNEEQKGYIIENKKTGKRHLTYESYAKKLSKEGKVRIISSEDEKDFREKMIKTIKTLDGSEACAGEYFFGCH